jgi:hypothetical protein
VRFSDDGICILSSITTRDECDAYIRFLSDERVRHEEALVEALRVADFYDRLSRVATSSAVIAPLLMPFYDSAAKRHQADLDGIAKRIKEIEAYRETL